CDRFSTTPPALLSHLSLHDALPISPNRERLVQGANRCREVAQVGQQHAQVRERRGDLDAMIACQAANDFQGAPVGGERLRPSTQDRKSTRLNSSHGSISYAVFCLNK